MVDFYYWLVIPRIKDRDQVRQGYILNTLLVGLAVLAGTAFVINLIAPLLYPQTKSNEDPLVTGFIFAFFCLLLLLSRRGKAAFSSLVLMLLLFLISLYGLYQWGADLPMMLLFLAMIIVFSGILLGTRVAQVFTLLSGLSIMTFSQLEVRGLYSPNNSWKAESLRATDAFVYAVILGLIGGVSWLSSSEIEKLLRRARESERALKKERDLLEQKVAQRTRELRLAQAEELNHLYRFAEFGRIASGLFHDLAGYVNLVSLNLEKLEGQGAGKGGGQLIGAQAAIARARLGTKKLAQFIEAAKRSIQGQQEPEDFSLKEIVYEVMDVFAYKAKSLGVKITFETKEEYCLYGDPVRFNQLLGNIVSNALDSYERKEGGRREVRIRVVKVAKALKLEVVDWGVGIARKNLGQIFEPFFSTKKKTQGIGLGLSIVKEIVEKNFRGKITVKSQAGKGTTFIVIIPLKRLKRGKS